MSKKRDEKNPKNLYRRGNSWVLNFVFHGERYVEVLGPMSRTVAKERRDKRKGDIASGELAVNGKVCAAQKFPLPDAPSLLQVPVLCDAVSALPCTALRKSVFVFPRLRGWLASTARS